MIPLGVTVYMLVVVFFGCGAPAETTPVRASAEAPRLVPANGGPIATGSVRDHDHNTYDDCGRCHEDTHGAWSASAHARGLDNPHFVAEWAPERLAFCSDCHAPLGPPASARAGEGVGCAACHVRDGTVLAYGARVPVTEPPHALARDTRDLDARLCGPCHDFPFPTRALAPHSDFDPNEPLQSTFREWRESRAMTEGRTCIDCHMRVEAGGHAMRLTGAADGPPIRIAHRYVGADRLELRIEATDAVGHAVPTGDVWRQLVIEVREVDADRITARARLGRTFAGQREADGHVLLRQTRDRRVPPPGRGETRVRLRVGAPPRALDVRVLIGRSGVRGDGLAPLEPGAAREILRVEVTP